jgi:hypothetical protein
MYIVYDKTEDILINLDNKKSISKRYISTIVMKVNKKTEEYEFFHFNKNKYTPIKFDEGDPLLDRFLERKELLLWHKLDKERLKHIVYHLYSGLKTANDRIKWNHNKDKIVFIKMDTAEKIIDILEWCIKNKNI